MGLFSAAVPRSSDWKPSTMQEAWVGAVFACVMADGNWSDTELDTISRQFLRSSPFIGISPSQLVGPMKQVGQDLGWAELGRRCGEAVPSEYAPTVFAMGCEMAMIDGDLHETERAVLEQLVTGLRLDQQLARKIVEVYEIRMKYQRSA